MAIAPKIMSTGADVRTKLLSGINTLSFAVKTTLGPKGRNVGFEKQAGVFALTKDGVTVANQVFLDDPIENMGAQMVKEVANKTAENAGDGTTTAIVLAEAIFQEGLKRMAAGISPVALKIGMDKAVEQIVADIKKNAIPVTTKEQIYQVAMVSSNFDTEVGEIITSAIEKVGVDGVITIEPSNTMETQLTLVDGMQFERGYMSPNFALDNENMVFEASDAWVLLVDKRIQSAQDLIPILGTIANSPKKNVLLIVEEMENDVIATFVMNKVKGVLNICVVKAPEFGSYMREQLQDIAAVTGATVIGEPEGFTIDQVNTAIGEIISKSGSVGPNGMPTPQMNAKIMEYLSSNILGEAGKITVSKNQTTIVNGKGSKEEIEKRLAQTIGQLERADRDYEKMMCQSRIGKLRGGVAIVQVGAPTELEMKEKKDRVDDALHATRAAIQEGIVTGGGSTLIQASKTINTEGWTWEQVAGADIIRSAISKPLYHIADNSGVKGDVIVDKVFSSSDREYGYDASIGEFGNLIAKGIVDPAKVTRLAIEYASSVSSMLLVMECAIVFNPEYLQEMRKLMNPSNMGGGMAG